MLKKPQISLSFQLKLKWPELEDEGKKIADP